jgi:tRNA uridine 5-carboxymethylaminomethyl modification enzyme
LVDDRRYEVFVRRREAIEREIERLKTVVIPPEVAADVLEKKGATAPARSVTALELLRRPEVTYADIRREKEDPREVPSDVALEVENRVKYEGYIRQQMAEVARFRKMEDQRIPPEIDYDTVKSLSNEGKDKLKRVRPLSIGQASRISGISSADLAALLIHFKRAGQFSDACGK